MQALQTKLSSTADQLSSAFSDPSNIPAMSKGLRDAADLLDDASTGLADISPPEDVAEPHAASAVSAFARLTSDLPPAADFQNIEQFGKLETAVNDIKAKGYDIGGS